MLGFLLSKTGLTLIAAALVASVIGVQEVRLKLADHAVSVARAERQTAQTGWDNCKASVAAQNASIAALNARSAEAMASAQKQQASAAPTARHIASQGAALAAYKAKGATRCEQWEDAERQVRESLK